MYRVVADQLCLLMQCGAKGLPAILYVFVDGHYVYNRLRAITTPNAAWRKNVHKRFFTSSPIGALFLVVIDPL